MKGRGVRTPPVTITPIEAEAIRKLIVLGAANASLSGDKRVSRWVKVAAKAHERWCKERSDIGLDGDSE